MTIDHTPGNTHRPLPGILPGQVVTARPGGQACAGNETNRGEIDADHHRGLGPLAEPPCSQHLNPNAGPAETLPELFLLYMEGTPLILAPDLQ